MITLVVIAYIAKVIIGLETGDYIQDASNTDMIETLEDFFWIFIAAWAAFEAAFDQETHQPIGVVFFLIIFGKMIGFLAWLLYIYKDPITEKRNRRFY